MLILSWFQSEKSIYVVGWHLYSLIVHIIFSNWSLVLFFHYSFVNDEVEFIPTTFRLQFCRI